MGEGVFGVAISGLNAAKYALTTTGHNIASAGTPGYSRQEVLQSSAIPQSTGGGFIGRGVDIDNIRRVFDEFVTRQVFEAQTQDSYLSTLQQHLRNIDNMLADASAGLTPALQSFFSGVQTVANDPRSIPARQSLLGLTQTMITNAQTINNRMEQMRQDANRQISTAVSGINAITEQIAQLNHDIQIATATSGGKPPNDLLDKREQLITDLNKYVRATPVVQSDGNVNLFIGSGQNLVVGNRWFQLAAVQASEDPQRLDVAYQQFGSNLVIPSQLLSGGTLGGVLAFRNNGLDVAQNALNRVVLGLAQTVNAQHRAGQDLQGNMGGNFFAFPLETTHFEYALGGGNAAFSASLTTNTPFISSDFNLTYHDASAVAPYTANSYVLTRLVDDQTVTFAATPGGLIPSGASAFGISLNAIGTTPWLDGESRSFSFLPAAGVIPDAGNTGTATLNVSINDIAQLTTSNYHFYFDGTDYRIVRQLDNHTSAITATQFAQPPIIVDGLSFSVSNSAGLVAGDHFLIKPTYNFVNNLSIAVNDTSQIAAASPVLATSNVLSVITSAATANSGGGSIAANVAFITSKAGAQPNPIEIVFSGVGSFDVRDATTKAVLLANQAYVSGNAINVNDFSVTISDSGVPPAAGDIFNITPRLNTGNATVSAGVPLGSPVSVELKTPVAVVFLSPTSYQIVDPTTGVVLQGAQSYASGGSVSFNGWSLRIHGTPEAGDVFMMGPNTAGVADARNILEIGTLQTKNTLEKGTTNYQGAYSKLVSDIGVQTNHVNVSQAAQAELLRQTQARQQTISGVNLDEEAANLLIFQQAYLASSRTIQVAQRIFDEVLQIGR